MPFLPDGTTLRLYSPNRNGMFHGILYSNMERNSLINLLINCQLGTERDIRTPLSDMEVEQYSPLSRQQLVDRVMQCTGQTRFHYDSSMSSFPNRSSEISPRLRPMSPTSYSPPQSVYSNRRLESRSHAYQNMTRDDLIKLLNSRVNGTPYEPSMPLSSTVRDQYDNYNKQDLINQLTQMLEPSRYISGTD